MLLVKTSNEMEISQEDVEKAKAGLLPLLSDCVTIMMNPDDGTFMMVVTRKGTLGIDAKRLMCDDIDTAMDFLRGFFPKTVEEPTPKNMPQILGKPQEIGFLSKAA